MGCEEANDNFQTKSTGHAKGLQPLGAFRGFAVAGCEADGVDIAPVFAGQVLYCMDTLGIAHEKLDVNGSAIAVRHSYDVSGTRLVGHALIEGKRHAVKYVVVTMYIGGGRGGSGSFGVL